MASQEYRYIVMEDPIPQFFAREQSRNLYERHRKIQTKFLVELERQHDDRPLLSGPLQLTAYFFMKLPSKTSNAYKEHLLHQQYAQYPPRLSHLIRFIEHCTKGVILDDESIIVSLTAIKKYDKTARTELIFVPL